MALTESRRQQLDQIVTKMAGESQPDEAIQSVVNDFKAKYEGEAPEANGNGMIEGAKSAAKALPGFLADLGTGMGKSVGGAVLGAGEMVHKIPGVRPAVDALMEGRVNWTGNPLTEDLIRPRTGPSLSETAFKEGQQTMQPSNTTQAVGKGIGNIGMLAVAPEGGLPATMAGNAAITGAQTSGDPLSMGLSAAAGGVAKGVGQGMKATGRYIQGVEAAPVAAKRTATLAKAAGESMDDPMWMEARGINAQKYGEMIRQYGLTGGKDDIAKIAAAPANQQEVLSAIANQLAKPRQLGHLWSILASGAGVAGAINPASLLVAGPLAAQGIITKYPGQSAAFLQKAADPFARMLQALGGAASNRKD